MTSNEMLISIKEIKSLLSTLHNGKIYNSPEKFKEYIEEFGHLLFNVFDELNNDINNVINQQKKDNLDKEFKINHLKDEIDYIKSKIKK